MFVSYRNIAVAFGLIFISCSSIALAQKVPSPPFEGEPIAAPRQQQGTPNGQQDGSSENQPSLNISPALKDIESAIRELIPKVDEVERERNKQHEIDDLQAQEDMALWAKRMFWATLATVFLTAVGIFLIWRTLVHSRRAADAALQMVIEAEKTTQVAQETAEISLKTAKHIATVERAWVFGSPVFENKKDGIASHSLAIKNHGKTPGFIRSLHAEMLKSEPFDSSPHYLGVTRQIEMVLPAGAMETYGGFVSFEPEYLAGYIRYTDIFGDIYISRFCFRVIQDERRFEMAGHPAWNAHYKETEA